MNEHNKIFAGCDVGSLTAKAVLINEKSILAADIIRVKATVLESATGVMENVLSASGLTFDDITLCCSTGYGRSGIPFADMDMSEISCHGMGAFYADNSIRTIIDIGGQDCKVISINEKGLINDFVMNDKCAAGTGRSLEMLAKTIGVELEALGPLTLKSRKPVNITNKCSIFMELEILEAMYEKKKLKHIAAGLSDAVAKRVADLSNGVEIRENICVTGGVSKNKGVIRQLEQHLNITFTRLGIDPQTTGALGAAVFAMHQERKHSA